MRNRLSRNPGCSVFALLAVVVLTLASCAGQISVKQKLDQADRVAFESLRLFQTMESGAYHAGAPWPTAAQHQQIGAKLSQAYTLVIDVANAGLHLQTGVPASQQLLTEVALLGQLVGEVVKLAQAAPPTIAVQATKANADTHALMSTVTGVP
jgi:hypothetical protein